MSIEQWVIFSTAVLVASIIPGPSMILALNHGIRYGYRKSISTAFGNVTASLIQAIISIIGLGSILRASENIFLIIKYLGAIYLIYIGVTTLFSKIKQINSNNDVSIHSKSNKKLFTQGFFVAFGNPKAIIFFTALFPQFFNMSKNPISQIIFFMITLAIIAFLCMMIYAITGSKIINLFSKSKLGKYFNKIIGIIFIGTGVSITFTND